MDWKKNGVSYILWLVYSAGVLVSILGATAFICSIYDYPAEYGFVGSVGYFLLVGLLVLLTGRMRCKWNDFAQKYNVTLKILEALFLVLMTATGVYLRIGHLETLGEPERGMEYFQAAMVTAGQQVPQVVHGATYLYLQLLHGLLFLLGNKLIVAYGLQLVLQIAAGIVLYFAVRKLTGVLAGLTTAAFFMLSPYMIAEAAVLSPAMLLLLLYAAVLCLIAGCLKKSVHPMLVCMVGILAGVIVYLDIFGITLLLFFFSIFGIKREMTNGYLRGKAAGFLFAVLGVIVGFVGSLGVDAWVSGKEFCNILSAWVKLYVPQEFSVFFLVQESLPAAIYAILDVIVLIAIMAIGCFSFWGSRRWERQSVWIAATAGLICLQGFGMQTRNAGCEMYLYLFFAVLAGAGLEALALPGRKIEVQEDAKVFEEVITEAVDDAVAESELSEPKIKFLDNPLPVPKKHEPRNFEYPVKDADIRDFYDHDVAEDDDFDI